MTTAKLLLGKFLCWITGKHKRRVRMDVLKQRDRDGTTLFCPRCGAWDRAPARRVKADA